MILGAAAAAFFYLLPYLMAPLWQQQSPRAIADRPSVAAWLGYPLLTLGAATLLAGALRGAICYGRARGRQRDMPPA